GRLGGGQGRPAGGGGRQGRRAGVGQLGGRRADRRGQRQDAVGLQVGGVHLRGGPDRDRPTAAVGEPVHRHRRGQAGGDGQAAAVGDVRVRRRPGLGQGRARLGRHPVEGGAAGQGERAGAADEPAVDERPVEGG